MPLHESDDPVTSQRLWHRLQIVKAFEDHVEGQYWGIATDGSDLGFDDTQTAPFQTSHIVGHCLSSGLDLLRTARFILVDPTKAQGIRLPMVGHFPVLRSAMEATALAIWIMGPDNGDERVSRTLRARWEDVVQDDQMVLALTEPISKDDKTQVARKNKMRRDNSKNVRAKKGRLREVAATAKISEATMLKGLPGFGPMLTEAAKTTGVDSNHQHGMWRLVSGLAHPSVSRSVAMSIVEDKSPGVGSVMSAELTASTALTNAVLDAALLLHWRALGLAAKRGGRPELQFVPSADLLPPGYEFPKGDSP